MTVLLDTHYLIWSLSADRRLSGRALDLLSDPQQDVVVSIVSLWEIAIKSSLGKLDLDGGVDGVLARLPEMGFGMLGIRNEHVAAVAKLPLHHRDPFDRMLIAQAKHEGMHLLTVDPHFGAYDVPLIK